MNNLLVFIGEKEKFEKEKVKKILSEVPGTHGLRDSDLIGSVLECKYDYSNDSTIVRLSDDLETISISGLGDASLNIALEIQRRMGLPLRAVDWDYSFDVDLSAFGSVHEFRVAISHNRV